MEEDPRASLLYVHGESNVSQWIRQHRGWVVMGVGALILAIAVAITLSIILAVSLTTSDDDDDGPGPAPQFPFVIATWSFVGAADAAWEQLIQPNATALDALEKGGNYCEDNPQDCGFSVGFGGNPNEDKETTLDAMVMWAPTREVGSVGCLKRTRHAISVARKVMEETYHTLLVGDDATRFARQMGFPEQNLTTNHSIEQWDNWAKNGHIPNYWKGPHNYSREGIIDETNHDTIGMVVIDKEGHVSCGTSTNGLRFKIAGRVGDSPIVGAGAYCDEDVGGAASTGDGDIMMRFLPARMIVYYMKTGKSPTQAISMVVEEIRQFYPNVDASFIAVNKKGQFGGGFMGRKDFPFVTRSPAASNTVIHYA